MTDYTDLERAERIIDRYTDDQDRPIPGAERLVRWAVRVMAEFHDDADRVAREFEAAVYYHR